MTVQSKLVSQASIHHLPEEMLERVAYYLPNQDLVNFSKTSTFHKKIAFSEYSQRILLQIKDLTKQLITFLNNPSDSLTKQKFSLIHWALTQPFFSTNTQRNQLITQAVVAQLTHSAAHQTSTFKAATSQALACGFSFYELEDLQALEKKIPDIFSAETLKAFSLYLTFLQRASLIIKTAESGNPLTLETLLDAYPISATTRSTALTKATFYGCLAHIKPLLDSGQVSEQALAMALKRCAASGYIQGLNSCLEHPQAISQDTHQTALKLAVETKQLKIVERLLEHQPITQACHLDLVLYAASKGHLDILKALFPTGSSLDSLKAAACIAAASEGQYEIVAYLMQSCRFGFRTKLAAFNAAYNKGHYAVAKQLLNLKPLVAALFTTTSLATLKYCQLQFEDN
jgi:hypothetical protein